MDETLPESQKASNPQPNWPAFALIVGFLIILGIVLVVLYLNPIQQNPTQPPTTAAAKLTTVTVSITKDGLLPLSLNIKKNTLVTWTNNDTVVHQIASDPYPADNALQEFGKGKALSTNESFSYVFNQTGTFSFHDEKNPLNKKFQLSVVVQ